MIKLSAMPRWLLDATNDKQRAPIRLAKSPSMPAQRIATTPYGQRALDNELMALRFTQEGGRNDRLNRAAHALAQLVVGGQIDAVQARSALVDVARGIGLGDEEIEQTIDSGWQAGWSEPRGPKNLAATPLQGPIIINASALAAMQFPDLQWAIPETLPEGLSILAGKPKLGKSFLSLQMAVAVASGDGKSFGLSQIEAGDVLVCALEDSERRLKERLTRMYPYGRFLDRLDFATTWPRIGAGGIEALDEWCDQHPSARLIVIDTWRAIKPPASGRGSAYDEDANAAAPLLEFSKRRPGIAVAVVHHVRKMESDDVFDMISGTHGLTGIFDTLIVLARHGEGAKLAAQGRDLDGYEKALERDKRTGGWIVRGDAVALAKTGERQELIDVLSGADTPVSLSDLAKGVGKKPDTTRHLLRALVDEGLVRQPNHGKYELTPSQFAQSAQSDEDESPF